MFPHLSPTEQPVAYFSYILPFSVRLQYCRAHPTINKHTRASLQLPLPYPPYCRDARSMVINDYDMKDQEYPPPQLIVCVSFFFHYIAYVSTSARAGTSSASRGVSWRSEQSYLVRRTSGGCGRRCGSWATWREPPSPHLRISSGLGATTDATELQTSKREKIFVLMVP